MTWVKVVDSFPDHPKVLEAGETAAWLYIAGLCFASRHLTDGFIPSKACRTLSTKSHPERLAARLVKAGLWEVVPGGWEIHDYLCEQRSREEVEREREDGRERSRRFRERKRNAVSNGEVTEPPKSREDNPPTPLPCSSCDGRGEVLPFGADTMEPCPDCREPRLKVVGS